MRNIKNEFKNKKAIALLAVIILILLIMAFMAAVLIYISNQSRVVEKRKVVDQASYNADKGVEWSKAEVAVHEYKYDKDTGNLINPGITFSSLPEGVKSINKVEYDHKEQYDHKVPSLKCKEGVGSVCNDHPFDNPYCGSFDEGYYDVGPIEHSCTVESVSEVYKITASTGEKSKALYQDEHTVDAELKKNIKELNVTLKEYKNTSTEWKECCVDLGTVELTFEEPGVTISDWEKKNSE